MIFRYWQADGKTEVIKDVDRIVFDSLVKLNVRFMKENRFEWQSFAFGDHYKQFTVTEE